MIPLTLVLALAGSGQDAPADPFPTAPAAIQWFTTWEQARAEAARTGRPILFTSAAPQCSGVPGIW